MKIKRLSSVFAAAVVAFSSLLSVAIIPAASAVVQDCAWKGAAAADLLFNNPANWNNCNSTFPQDGDNLVFDSTTLTSSVILDNNIAGLTINNITFQGTGSSYYTLMGNAFTLTGNLTSGASNYPSIMNDIVLAGNISISGGMFTLSGDISGTGNLSNSSSVLLYGANTFTGSVTQTAGTLALSKATSAGNSANTITINNAADININDCAGTSFTVPYNLVLNGVSSDTVAVGKIKVGGSCSQSGGGGGYEQVYGVASPSDQTATLSGNITLGSDITFEAYAKTVNLTGVLSGAHSISMMHTTGGTIVINSSSNGSSTPNGTLTVPAEVVTISDNQASKTVEINNGATVTLDGVRSDTMVTSGGKLMGSGTVGILDVLTGGIVAPGHSPGCLTSGAFTLSGTYEAELGGTTACTEYDQMKVTGTVTLTGGTLNTVLYNNYKPAKGATYTIIDNDGSDAVTGTFTGLAEGATFTVDGYVFAVSYTGGDGNDVVLTVQNVPATPDTGFAMIAAHPGATLAITLALAGSIFAIAKYNSRKVAVRTRR